MVQQAHIINQVVYINAKIKRCHNAPVKLMGINTARFQRLVAAENKDFCQG